MLTCNGLLRNLFPIVMHTCDDRNDRIIQLNANLKLQSSKQSSRLFDKAWQVFRDACGGVGVGGWERGTMLLLRESKVRQGGVTHRCTAVTAEWLWFL